MTPEALAALQARAYRDMAPWSAQDFKDLLALPTTELFTASQAFLLTRTVVDEAEILAVATDPGSQRQGAARELMARFHTQVASKGVSRVLLEVAQTNTAARAFYAAQGYADIGQRKSYYRQPDGTTVDAVLMARALGA